MLNNFKYYIAILLILLTASHISSQNSKIKYWSNRSQLSSSLKISDFDLIKANGKEVLFIYTDIEEKITKKLFTPATLPQKIKIEKYFNQTYKMCFSIYAEPIPKISHINTEHQKKHKLMGIIYTAPNFSSSLKVTLPRFINPKNLNLYTHNGKIFLAVKNANNYIQTYIFNRTTLSFSAVNSIFTEEKVHSFNIKSINDTLFLTYSTPKNEFTFKTLSKSKHSKEWYKNGSLRTDSSFPPKVYKLRNETYLLFSSKTFNKVTLKNIKNSKSITLDTFESKNPPALVKIDENYYIVANDTIHSTISFYKLDEFKNGKPISMTKKVFIPLYYGNNRFTITEFNDTPIFTQIRLTKIVTFSVYDEQTIKQGGFLFRLINSLLTKSNKKA